MCTPARVSFVDIHRPRERHARENVHRVWRPPRSTLEILHPNAVPAVLEHVVRLGPRVRLELLASAGRTPLEVEISADMYSSLGVNAGDTLHIAPRRARVFPIAAAKAA